MSNVKMTVNMPADLRDGIERVRKALMVDCPTVKYISAEKIINHILRNCIADMVANEDAYNNYRDVYSEDEKENELADSFRDFYILDKHMPRLMYNYGSRAEAQRRGEDMIKLAHGTGADPDELITAMLKGFGVPDNVDVTTAVNDELKQWGQSLAEELNEKLGIAFGINNNG